MRGLKEKKRGKLYLAMSFDLGTDNPDRANTRITVLEAAIPWDLLKRHGIEYEIGEIHEGHF